MTYRAPTNAAAIEIERRRSENRDIDTQIATLREKQNENSETIGILSNVATWEAVPEVIPEPEPEPEEPGLETPPESNGEEVVIPEVTTEEEEIPSGEEAV